MILGEHKVISQQRIHTKMCMATKLTTCGSGMEVKQSVLQVEEKNSTFFKYHTFFETPCNPVVMVCIDMMTHPHHEHGDCVTLCNSPCYVMLCLRNFE